MPALAALHEQRSGASIAADFAPTVALMRRIGAGETADIAILTRQGVDELAERGILAPASVVDVALSLVGIAVKAGAARPDISSLDALESTLLEARSIAYSRIGASGIFFAELIERLGIADAVNAKATITAGGLTAELAARGEVELAVQQVSELMLVPGIDVVGPLPPAVQSPAMFSAGIFASAADAAAADEFVSFIASGEAAPLLGAAGLLPPSDRGCA